MKRVILAVILLVLLFTLLCSCNETVTTLESTTACPTETPVTTSTPVTTKSYAPITVMAPEDAEIYVSLWGEPDHAGGSIQKDLISKLYTDPSVTKNMVYSWHNTTFELAYEFSEYLYHKYSIQGLGVLSHINFYIETGALRNLACIPYDRVGVTYSGTETENELKELFWSLVDPSYEASNFKFQFKTIYTIQTEDGTEHGYKEEYYSPAENETITEREILYVRYIDGIKTEEQIRLILEKDSFTLIFYRNEKMKDEYFAQITKQKESMVERAKQYLEAKFSQNATVISSSDVNCYYDYVNQVPYLCVTVSVKYRVSEDDPQSKSYRDTVRCTLTCYQPQYENPIE
ncbi:MAG: hypothetical protein IKC63_03390 [Clostridia bacterium]|nr:hypothetical protein [Clostridia bacterium]